MRERGGLRGSGRASRFGGNEQGCAEADQADDSERDHCGGVGMRGQTGDEDRSRDGGAERGAEVRDAARQPGDLALLMFGECGLHDIDRWCQHCAEPEPDERQSGCERPRAR